MIRARSVLSVCLLAVLTTACGSDSSSSTSFAADSAAQRFAARFPVQPDTDMTPGKLCDRPDSYRYPERVPYCTRDVSSGTKNSIIREYDDTFGYSIGAMNRGEFKIDHFIPLCMGGSNDRANLWPQHRSVYDITDPLEGPLCELMASGDMKQAEAVEIIRRAKFNHDQVPAILDQIDARRHR